MLTAKNDTKYVDTWTFEQIMAPVTRNFKTTDKLLAKVNLKFDNYYFDRLTCYPGFPNCQMSPGDFIYFLLSLQ